VDYMASMMTSQQITEWEAFYKMEPFGVDRVEYLLSMFMFMYASANRGKGKKPRQKDFLPFLYKKPSDEKLWEEWFRMQTMKDFDNGY